MNNGMLVSRIIFLTSFASSLPIVTAMKMTSTFLLRVAGLIFQLFLVVGVVGTLMGGTPVGRNTRQGRVLSHCC